MQNIKGLRKETFLDFVILKLEYYFKAMLIKKAIFDIDGLILKHIIPHLATV